MKAGTLFSHCCTYVAVSVPGNEAQFPFLSARMVAVAEAKGNGGGKEAAAAPGGAATGGDGSCDIQGKKCSKEACEEGDEEQQTNI